VPSEFDPQWLTLVGNRLALHPWEYAHEIKSGRETKTITMASPVRWVVSFTSAYTLSQARQGIAGKSERRAEHIRQFVVNARVTQLMTIHTPGLGALLADLRYQSKTDVSPDVPKLPLTTITASLPSFRPSHELIFSAVTFFGGSGLHRADRCRGAAEAGGSAEGADRGAGPVAQRPFSSSPPGSRACGRSVSLASY
jgi:hypothetical protein